MSRPLPGTGSPPTELLLADAHRYAALADALGEIAVQVARLAAGVATDWPDALGREWAEGAVRLRRELERTADAAAEVGAELARRSGDGIALPGSPGSGQVGSVGPLGAAGPPPGRPRLGGTDARRVEDDRGMRIAQLPPEVDPPG